MTVTPTTAIRIEETDPEIRKNAKDAKIYYEIQGATVIADFALDMLTSAVRNGRPCPCQVALHIRSGWPP